MSPTRSQEGYSRHVPPDYAKRILAIRGRLDLTQAEFAERLGVSHVSVCRWEKGKSKPTHSFWRQIRKLEVGAFGGTDPAEADLFALFMKRRQIPTPR